MAIGLAALTAAVSAETTPLVRGAQLLTQGRPKAAVGEFAAAVGEDPECAEAQVGVGASQLHLGDTMRALEAFNRALAIDKTSRPARLGVATAFFQDGEYDKALPQYRYCLAFECSERPAVRAAAACSACILGLYEAAEAEASLALREDPSSELARTVAGATWIARGDPARAAEVLSSVQSSESALDLAPRFALATPSPLFSPTAHYFVANDMRDESRLAFLGKEAASGYPSIGGPGGEEVEYEPPPEVEEEGFRIIRPRPGTAVSGRTSVVVEVPPDLAVDYLALLVDDKFQAITNTDPFRMSINADRLSAGQHQIRVEAYGPHGDRVATAASLVIAGRGRERTLSYEERMRRKAVSRQLERLLVIRATPATRLQLLGHALRTTGRLEEAVEAFEQAFAMQPAAPGIRADLLTAYQEQGLDVGTKGREVHFAPDGRTVALTFDDGPHPLITPRLLALLDEYQVRATFFLVGKQVELYPELAAEIVNRGHEVGSHSYSHSNLRRFPKVYVERELVKSRAAIRKATGRTVTLFRPPGGNYDNDVRAAVAETGYTTIFWTANIGDCAGWTPDATVEKFMTELERGGIVLMHNGEDGSLEALGPLLTRLAQERRLVGSVGAWNSGGAEYGR